MSEYQYYRFACLDGHLESKQREELRRISSRSEINATSFQVYYLYGGFKDQYIWELPVFLHSHQAFITYFISRFVLFNEPIF